MRVTPARLRHWVTQFNKFRKNGNVVPISFDHDSARLTPLSLNEFRTAKDTVGKLANLELSGDGTSALMTLDISDPKAASMARANDVFVSPVLASEWMDGRGRNFRDIWSHVDIVNHPVDNTQGPFVAMSSDRKTVKYWRFSVMTDELLDDEVATTDALDDEMEGGSEEDAFVDDAQIDIPEEFDSGYSPVPEIMAELAQIGILLGEDTGEANFLDRLLPALKTYIAQKNKMDSMDEAMEGGFGEEPMELEQQQFQQMSSAAQVLFRNATKQHQNTVASKLATLFNDGRCSAKEYREMKARIGSVRMSTSTGKPLANAVEFWIDSRQGIPKGACWSKEQRTQRMSLESRPKVLTNDQTISDGQATDIANRIVKGRRG